MIGGHAISLWPRSDRRLRLLGRPLRNERSLPRQRHDQPALPEILHGPPHRPHRDTSLLGHLPLTLQPGTRPQHTGLNTPRHPVRDLPPRIHRPARVNDTLLIAHEWNVKIRTASCPRR